MCGGRGGDHAGEGGVREGGAPGVQVRGVAIWVCGLEV
jgi:hypothetical protein